MYTVYPGLAEATERQVSHSGQLYFATRRRLFRLQERSKRSRHGDSCFACTISGSYHWSNPVQPLIPVQQSQGLRRNESVRERCRLRRYYPGRRAPPLPLPLPLLPLLLPLPLELPLPLTLTLQQPLISRLQMLLRALFVLKISLMAKKMHYFAKVRANSGSTVTARVFHSYSFSRCQHRQARSFVHFAVSRTMTMRSVLRTAVKSLTKEVVELKLEIQKLRERPQKDTVAEQPIVPASETVSWATLTGRRTKHGVQSIRGVGGGGRGGGVGGGSEGNGVGGGGRGGGVGRGRRGSGVGGGGRGGGPRGGDQVCGRSGRGEKEVVGKVDPNYFNVRRKRVSIDNARKVWGTLRSTTCSAVTNAIKRLV